MRVFMTTMTAVIYNFICIFTVNANVIHVLTNGAKMHNGVLLLLQKKK